MLPFLRSFFVVSLMLFSSWASATKMVQEFFVPLPEDQVQKSLSTIASGVGAQMSTVISIVVTSDNTYIHYDHWEDGYEVDLGNPTQASTEIMGPYNKGQVISLRNTVDLPRNPAVRKYDGRDRIGASVAVVATRAEWATSPGTVLAGAAEMLSIRDYGTDFKMPVGQNLNSMDNGMFSYVGLLMVAANDNTNCTYTDVNSVVTSLPTLNRGSNYQVNGGVKAGDHLVCDKPVQVHLITGKVGATYESRWFLVYPTSRWSSDYYAPVGTSANNDTGYVFVYNPGAGATTVSYETLTGTGSFSVPANGVYRFQMPVSSGGHFYSSGAPFYAVATLGATPSANNVHDWGMLLVPKAALTTEVVAGWAPGNGNTPPTDNGSPLWITTERDTVIYVDYAGNGGAQTASNGQAYDIAFTVKRLQSTIVGAPNFDATGTRIFTTDGTLITGAWGQNSAVAGAGAPYLDMGTALLPFPVPTIKKSVALQVDNNSNTRPDTGDTVRYTLTVNNAGLTALNSINVVDDLGAGAGGGLNYVAGSTKLNGVAVTDGGGGAFPLTGPAGVLIQEIPPGEFSTIVYDAVITRTGTITNLAYLANPNIRSSATVTVTQPIPAICTLAFTNNIGTTVTTYGVGDTIYLKLTNSDLNQSVSAVEQVMVTLKNPVAGSKDIENVTLTETGVNTGVFTGSIPSSSSAGQTVNDGTFFLQLSDSIQVSSTYPTCSAATASVPLPTKTKTLYLKDDGTSGDQTGGMSRTVPTSASAKSTAVLNAGSAASIAVGGATTSGSSSSGSAVTSLTFSHTPGSGSNRLLLVAVATGSPDNSNNQGAVSGVTFNGQAMTLVGSKVSGSGTNSDSYIYMLKDANITTSAAANVVVSTTSATIVASATTFTGVNQTTPLGTYVSASGSGSGGSFSLSPNYASAAGELVYSIGSIEQGSTNRTIGTGAGQTELWNISSHGYVDAATSTIAGAVSVPVSYTNGNNRAWTLGVVSIKPAVVTGQSTATFTQSPAMASAFAMPSGSSVSLVACINVTAGSMPASPGITATLKRASTLFATLSSPSYSANTLSCGNGPGLTWTGTLGSDVTVASSEAISTAFDLSSLSSSISFTIDYDGTGKISRLDLPTTTVITVDSVGVYDAAYPGGALAATGNNGQTLYVRTTVSDPFGAYDINGVGLNIDGPGVTCDLTPTLGVGSVVNTGTGTKVYEYAWSTSSCEGDYTVTATANEGTEGTITGTGSTHIKLTNLDLGTPAVLQFVDNGFADKTSYTTAQQVCLKLTDLDQAGRAEPIQVFVTGSISGAQSAITLTESPASSGIFKGCFGSSGSSTPFVNGDVLSGTYTDPTDATDVATDTAVVAAPGALIPSLLISKTRASQPNGIAIVGNSVQYDIAVTNTSGSALSTIALTDTYSAACYNYQSSSLLPSSNSAGSLGWTNIGPIAPGATVRVSVTLVAAAVCNSAAAINSASASGDASAGPATATVTINKPAVTVVKTLTSGAGPVVIGSTVQFSIQVTNSGNTVLNSVPLSDNYSTCLAFQSSSPAATSSGGGVALWSNLGTLSVGASTTVTTDFKVVGTCSPALNTAEVSFAQDVNGNTAVPGSSSASVATQGASLTGKVINDANGNGNIDSGELGIADVTVKLYKDPNGDGDLSDATLISVQATDSAGNYSFSGLAINTGTERYILVEVDPPTYHSTNPVSNQLVVNATLVQDYPNQNFLDTKLSLANLTLTKVGPATVLTGGAMSYTLTLGNSGSTTSGTSATLKDQLPAGVVATAVTAGGGVSAVNCGSLPSSAAALLSCSVTLSSGLATGATATFTVSATAPATAGAITNYASVDPTGGNSPATPGAACVSSSCSNASTTVVVPAWSITKTHTGSMPAGGTGSYTITVSNSGSAPTSGLVTVTDTPPAGLAVTGMAGTNWSCTGSTCTRSDALAASAAYDAITVTVSVAANASTPLVNSATVSGGGVPSSATATDSTSIQVGADVIVQKNGPASVAASGQITYTVRVDNAGPAAADGTVVTDNLPNGASAMSWVCGNAVGGAVCPAASGNGALSQTVASLPAGGGLVFSVTMTAPASGTVTNLASAVVPAGVLDTNPANNSSSVNTVIGSVGSNADLVVVKSGPASVAANGTVAYKIVVSNAGPAAAHGAVFADNAVTAGLTGVSWTCGSAIGGALCPNNSGSNAISETLAQFPAGASLTYTVQGTAPANGSVTNTATVTAPLGVTDPDSSNNSASVNTSVTVIAGAANLAIAKTGLTAVNASASLSYQLVVSNIGPDAVVGARVQDSVPAAVSGVTWTCSAGASGGTCQTGNGSGNNVDVLVNLPVGANVSLVLTGTAPASANRFLNQARVSTPVGVTDTDPSNNVSGAVIVTVRGGTPAVYPDVYTTVSVPASVNNGDVVNALITFGNQGNASAEGVGYQVTLATGLSAVSCGGASCSYNPATGVVTVTGLPTTLSSGQSLALNLSYTAPGGSNVLNLPVSSQISTSTAGETPTNNNAASATTVTNGGGQGAQADLTTWVSAPASVYAGSAVVVNLGFSNIGAANGTTVTYRLQGLPVATVVSYSGVACTWDQGTGSITGCSLPGNLPIGQSIELQATYTAPASGPVTATSTVGAANDGNAGNNTASASTVILSTPPTPIADVMTRLSVPASAGRGKTVMVPVTFGNLGPATAQGVAYGLTLGAGATNPVVTYNGVACGYAGSAITGCGLPVSLNVGQSLGLSLSFTAPNVTGTVAVISSISTSSTESTQANNSASGNVSVIAQTPSTGISGRIWYDTNGNRIFDAGESGRAGWLVELMQGGQVIDQTRTDANGQYAFTGLADGVYSVRFMPRIGWGLLPVNGESGSSVPGGGVPGVSILSNIVISSNPSGALGRDAALPQPFVVEQSLPLNPTGTVYDGQSRRAIAGATVTLGYSCGTVDPSWVAGGSSSVTTGADGSYALYLLTSAPSGPGCNYTLSATGAGYRFPSTVVPATAGSWPSLGGSISGVVGAPTTGQATTYYLQGPKPTLDLSTNNLPLDPITPVPTGMASIPTLSEWALMLLAALMAMAAALRLRTRGYAH